MIKVIKSHAEYEAALAALEGLLDQDPDPVTPEAEKLEVLTIVIQHYESETYKRRKPDPLEAIKFRMEQQNLRPRDLAPSLGGRSKVSEILAGKRSLTLSMIRALHENLGIPADVLLSEGKPAGMEDIEWERFPVREMLRRGWLTDKVEDFRREAEGLIRGYFAPLGSAGDLAALYRKTDAARSARRIDRYALTAWTARVMRQALENPPKTKYVPGTVDLHFMRDVARLSWSDTGPLLAREYLFKHGISFVVEPHLPRTLLDGAAMMASDGRPVVALTIRYDRLDNFWFCLMHELAHIALHFDEADASFYDDLDVESKENALEVQADELAQEALIPSDEWTNNQSRQLKTSDAARDLAKRLHISPAIVAGRVRHELKNYRLLKQLVGHRQVRRHFTEAIWG